MNSIATYCFYMLEMVMTKSKFKERIRKGPPFGWPMAFALCVVCMCVFYEVSEFYVSDDPGFDV